VIWGELLTEFGACIFSFKGFHQNNVPVFRLRAYLRILRLGKKILSLGAILYFPPNEFDNETGVFLIGQNT
jgi:hypothetical protein